MLVTRNSSHMCYDNWSSELGHAWGPVSGQTLKLDKEGVVGVMNAVINKVGYKFER